MQQRSFGCSHYFVSLDFCNLPPKVLISLGPIRHSHSKHVEIDIHFMRDYVANGVLDVLFVSTKDQLADILTKPLSSLRFFMLKNKLSVLSNLLRLRGGVRDINDNT